MTGPGSPARDTEVAGFHSYTWRGRLCCWRSGTWDARFPRALRDPGRREKGKSDFGITRLTCTGGQGTPERGTAAWSSHPSSCGSSWNRRSSGTWASRCRPALITLQSWDTRVAANSERSSRGTRVRLDLYLNRGTGNPCAGHTRAWEPSTSVRKPRTSSVDGIFGRTLPTGSRKHAMFRLFFTFSLYVLCELDTKHPRRKYVDGRSSVTSNSECLLERWHYCFASTRLMRREPLH